jgi:UDP-N-acetylmuramoylalanine--D-glutamate ligase
VSLNSHVSNAHHLAYHGTIENYKSAKFKISQCQTMDDLLILNADDPASSENIPPVDAKIKYFSMNYNSANIMTRDGILIFKESDPDEFEEIIPISEIGIPGDHNVYNSMAAILALKFIGISNDVIRKGLMTFGGVEHRLEFVRSFNEVDYINDSKATNIDATRYALSSYDKPLIWLAGGRGDSNDYSLLDELVEKNVRAIVAIGEEADAIIEHFSGTTACVKQDTMEDAVRAASQLDDKVEIVLFTPASKSFDMFPNYEVRGEIFKECVAAL